MDFLLHFLDINTWVSLLNVIIIPFQTLADFVFESLPESITMLNRFLVVLSDVGMLFIDFLSDLSLIMVDFFENGVYELIKTLLDNTLSFISAVQPILEILISVLIDLINWIMEALISILNALGNLFGGDGFSEITWTPITGWEGSGLGGGGFAGGGAGVSGGGSHTRP